ncbi:hypothetical protein NT6N_05790 [Oceaniferula spumae]|uniref:HEAT repeat domain-containing protein n=1 Tax=Oceaniferula spumae TaxID=2979115 RepID=A0AAT9FHN2_9BACT
MKSKSIVISAAWLLSLTIAFIVGAKMQSADPDDSANISEENARASHRSYSRATAATSRMSSGSRTSAASSGDSNKSLNVVDIIKQDDPISRVSSLLALINRLGPNDFEQVVADFRASGLTRDRMSEYSMLLHAWAKTDPIAALDYAEKNTGSRFARETILTSWASENPSAALQWAETHHEGDGANPWLIGVIRGVAKSDPARATEIMATLPYSRERGDALAAIIPHITSQGSEEAVAWLNSISDDQLRSGATRYIARNLASKDPESTASWATSITNKEERERAIGEVADTWADSDVSSAVAWTETLHGDEKMRAASELMGEYTREDPEQAARWLDSMAGSDGYDQVARSFIWSSARSDPAMALSKVNTIADTDSQGRYYDRILRDWHGRDATAAESWMNANNVSDQIRQRVVRPRDDRRRGR